MRQIIHLFTHRREELLDITPQVRATVKASGIRQGLVSVYAQGATAATMIQENWDESVQTDVVNLLRSETIPVIDGELGLSRWQNIFFCEFDGPRSDRRVVCTVLADREG